jgi:hypothetical protein
MNEKKSPVPARFPRDLIQMRWTTGVEIMGGLASFPEASEDFAPAGGS